MPDVYRRVCKLRWIRGLTLCRPARSARSALWAGGAEPAEPAEPPCDLGGRIKHDANPESGWGSLSPASHLSRRICRCLAARITNFSRNSHEISALFFLDFESQNCALCDKNCTLCHHTATGSAECSAISIAAFMPCRAALLSVRANAAGPFFLFIFSPPSALHC